MHNELRYQVRIHAISNKPREKKSPANSPQIFFFLILKKTTSNMEKTSYAKTRLNLCTLNDAITEK
jgi:Leucine-rich repeat (LRR) protein